MYPSTAGAFGTWKGNRVSIEGHGHVPEMGICFVYRSDDAGKTWTKHPGGLMGWFDFEGSVNGQSGLTPCFEPTIAETKSGGVLLIARSTVGRLVTPLQVIDTPVDHDRPEPGAQTARVSQRPESLVGLDKRILGQIFRIMEVPEPHQRYTEHRILVAVHDRSERLRTVFQGIGNQCHILVHELSVRLALIRYVK